MARVFCIPGIIFLFCAFVLSFLVSISLPYLTALDIVRTTFDNGVTLESDGIREIRFGLWAPCRYSTNDEKTCLEAHGGGYIVGVEAPNDQGSVIIGSSWTKGLAVHPVAAAATFLALCFSFSQHITVTLISSLLSFFAALLTLIAFAIDIALYVKVRHEMKKLADVNDNTDAGPGFWMTLVALILLLLAGFTVCFGRRKERLSGAYPSYPTSSTKTSWLSRFRRK